MHKKFCTFILSSVIVFISGCVGNNNQSNSDSKTSVQLNKILNTYVNNYGKDNYFSAISATVKCGNSNSINGIAGTMTLDGNTPIDVNSLFQIGSTSKSFTSVVILQLADDPKYNFNLNDTIGKWFKNTDGSSTYPQWDNITIVQLMNMTSGIPEYVNEAPAILVKSLTDPNYYFAPDELVDAVKTMPVHFAPGKGFNYSNTNYILLGILIQKITGNSPITEIQNRIINKLNLTHTYFPGNLPASIVPMNQMVNGYGYFDFFPDPFTQLNGLHNITLSSLSFYYTAGGIISTPEDLTTYTQALYHPGQLLTETQIKNLTTKYMVAQSPTDGFPSGGQPITQVSENITVGYGLGIFNIYAPEPLGSYYMYNGATLGYGSFYAYYPKNNMFNVFMVNNGVNMTIQNKTYQNLINEITQYIATTQCQ